MTWRILQGDVFETLATIEPGSVDCAVTSPPYWQLRSYLPKGHELKKFELGSEPTIAEYIANQVEVMRGVRNALAEHGTVWLNVGDTYSGGGRGGGGRDSIGSEGVSSPDSIDSGNLCLIPQRLMIALQAPEEHCVIKKEVDRAWLAALIDGEGCISIRRFDGKSRSSGKPCQDGFVPFICIGNNDRELLDRCVQITGYGSVSIKQRADTTDGRGIVSRRDNYGWRIESAKAIEIICDVYPYLIAKRKQAILAHTLACHNRSGKKLRGWQQPLPPAEQEKRVLLKRLINQCNQREPVDLPDWCVEPSVTIAPGWYVRSVVIWAKPSPMPASLSGWKWQRCRVKVKEKVRVSGTKSGTAEWNYGGGFAGDSPAQWKDCPGCPKCEPTGGYILRRGSWRPTSSYEPVIMLAKSAKYFADGEPVKTPPKSATVSRDQYTRVLDDADEQFAVKHDHETNAAAGANLRDVWTIASESLHEKHYAAFPTKLVMQCLKASASEKGYCRTCGKPWVRMVESEKHFESGSGRSGNAIIGKNGNRLQGGGDTGDIRKGPVIDTKTIGWRPSCQCTDNEPRPGLVLDPFCGSGRTGVAARRLGLDFVGCELNETYVEMANRRIESALRDHKRPPKEKKSGDLFASLNGDPS